MKALFVTLLLAILAVGLCLPKTCSRFRVSVRRNFHKGHKEWVYRIGLLSDDNGTFTVKLEYTTFANDAILWTPYAYLVRQQGNEYTFKLNAKGKQELHRVRRFVPCRYGFIKMRVYSYITKQPRPEISELHVGNVDCIVHSAQCPRFSSCRKHHLSRVSRRANGDRYVAGYIRIPEPRFMRSNIIVALDLPVGSLKVEGARYLSSDCNQIYQFERKTYRRRRLNIRLRYSFELPRKGAIPSIVYISVGNNACNSTCGERVICPTSPKFNGTNTKLQGLNMTPSPRAPSRNMSASQPPPSMTSTSPALSGFGFGEDGPSQAGLEDETALAGFEDDMTSLLDQAISSSHGIYKRSHGWHSTFRMLRRMRYQARALLRTVYRWRRGSRIIHRHVFRKLRGLRSLLRTLLNRISEWRKESTIKKLSTSSPRRTFKVYQTSMTSASPRSPSSMSVSPRSLSSTATSPAVSGFEFEEDDTALPGFEKDETALPRALPGFEKDETALAGFEKDETALGGFEKDETALAGFEKDETALAGFEKDETALAGFEKDETALPRALPGIEKDETALAGFEKDETALAGFEKDELAQAGLEEDETTLAGLEEDDMTSLLDQAISSSHGIYKRSYGWHSTFRMLRRMIYQARALLKRVYRWRRGSRIIHRHIFRRLRGLKYLSRTLLNRISKWRKESTRTKKLSTSSPRRTFKVYPTSMTSASPRSPSSMSVSPRSSSRTATSPAVSGFGFGEDDTALPGFEKDDTALPGFEKDDTVLRGFEKDETALAVLEKGETALAGSEKDETALAGLEQYETGLAGLEEDDTALAGLEEDETALAGLGLGWAWRR